MKFSLSRMLLLSTLGLAVSLGSAYAGQATFHLPFSAHWGIAYMVPGDYRITLPEGDSPASIFYLQSKSQRGFAVAGTFWQDVPQDKSYLKLVNVNGEYYVKQFVLATNGKVFLFPTPKPSNRQQLAERVISIDNQGTK
jgi:hypothetical protein